MADHTSAAPVVGDAVFTTIPWDGHAALAHVDHHLNRLRQHAERLRLALPQDLDARMITAAAGTPLAGPPRSDPPSGAVPPGLARLEVTRDGRVAWSLRHALARPEGPLVAMTAPAPRWTRRVTGTKHGDWALYEAARRVAERRGAEVALLVHDAAIVDADRATPMLLDADGTAWLATPDSGGVDSITVALVAPALATAGIPLQWGRLVASLVARAVEVIVLGSGLGAVAIEEIDGEPVGTRHAMRLLDTCLEAIDRAHATAWTSLEQTLGPEANR